MNSSWVKMTQEERKEDQEKNSVTVWIKPLLDNGECDWRCPFAISILNGKGRGCNFDWSKNNKPIDGSDCPRAKNSRHKPNRMTW